MKYIVKLFRFVIEVVILIALTIVFAIRIVKYTILYKLNKLYGCDYKQYVSNAYHNYYYDCARYDIINADEAADAYNEFLKKMNKI